MKSEYCPSCKSQGLKSDYLFCPYCGISLPKAGKCLNCGHQNAPNAKFCQECGNPLVFAEQKKQTRTAPKSSVLEAEPIPATGVTIEFGYSSSANYDNAVQAAELFSSYKKYGNGNNVVHRVHVDSSQIESSAELVHYISGWKSFRLFVEGEPTTWYTIYSFSWCYNQKRNSFKPNLYCFGYENDRELNIWGCNQARMPFREHANWFQWGKWLDKKGTWEFDKERIRFELQKSLYRYRLCPAIQLELVEDALNALPDTVNPNRDKNWKFVESWERDGMTQGLEVSVNRFGYKETVVMKGVAPNGNGALQEILKRMRNRLPDEIINLQ